MRYSVKLLAAAALMAASSSAGSASILLVEDFNTTSFIGPTGQPHNAWNVNPGDPTSGAVAGFVRNRGGHALMITYNVDSPITYHFGDTYILDYSEFNIVGMAAGLPHVSSCGYYFLLGDADLSRYSYLVFSARGDEKSGFTRRMQLELKTANRSSSFMLEGLTSSWKKFTIPLAVFDRIDDWQNVTEFTIAFNESVTAERGVIYLDNIYFAENPDDVPLASGGHSPPGAFHDVFQYRFHPFAGVSANYRQTPDRGSELFSAAEAVIQAQSGSLTGRIKASIDSQEFGSSGYREYLDEYPYTRFTAGDRGISFPTIQLKLNELTPLASRITVGDLYLGYSQYLFQPFFGWKGLKVEGARDIFDHSTFIIKKQLNSFAAGSRAMAYLGDHRLQIIGVYDSDTAMLDTSEGTPGALADGGIDIRQISSEFSWLGSLLFRFMDYRLNLELNYADFRARKFGNADYEYPASPVFSSSVTGSDLSDNMHEAKLYLTGMPVYGSKFLFSYRNVGTDFTPAYRQEPVLFEEVFGDQRGVLIRGEQWYGNIGASVYWDSLDRISNNEYFRDVINYGLMYRGPSEMEIRISREHKQEKYAFGEEGDERFITPKDFKANSSIISGRYNFLYADTPGIRLPLAMTLEFREDRIDNIKYGEKEVNHSLSLGFEYRLGTDFGFSAVYRAATRNNPDDLNDNSLNIYISGIF